MYEHILVNMLKCKARYFLLITYTVYILYYLIVQVRERLLHSLHEQLSNFLCFTPEEKVYNYEDPTARKTMQDALQLR